MITHTKEACYEMERIQRRGTFLIKRRIRGIPFGYSSNPKLIANELYIYIYKVSLSLDGIKSNLVSFFEFE